jgi:hypothetical protein
MAQFFFTSKENASISTSQTAMLSKNFEAKLMFSTVLYFLSGTSRYCADAGTGT